MDINEILDLIPHRYPFILVDRILALTPGEEITGYKNVSSNEPFFQGHFPQRPIMPGVLIIEAMAQLSGVLAYKTLGQRASEGSLYYLAGVDKTRFKRPVVPGDRLMMHGEIVSQRRQTMKLSCSAHVDEELACTTELLCVELQV